MAAVSVTQFLTLYTWFPLAFVLVFLLLIARFYQRFSSTRTYYEWFALPLFLFGAAAMRYSSVDQLAGDWIGDVLLGGGGIMLLALSLFLYYRMTRSR
ncbi:MAG: hypothetical protein R3E39_21690 [Anaerolineae bacterium]